MLCSISFNKTFDENLAFSHDNTSGREPEGRLFLRSSNCIESSPAATKVWASFQLSATPYVSSHDMICSSLSLSASGSTTCEGLFKVCSPVKLYSKLETYSSCFGVMSLR